MGRSYTRNNPCQQKLSIPTEDRSRHTGALFGVATALAVKNPDRRSRQIKARQATVHDFSRAPVELWFSVAFNVKGHGDRANVGFHRVGQFPESVYAVLYLAFEVAKIEKFIRKAVERLWVERVKDLL
jgi:hypothetical protein